jgi:hypothetical protein
MLDLQITVQELKFKVLSSGKKLRVRRMNDFIKLMNLPSGARIIDLGGNHMLWDLIDHNFDITLINLPGSPGSTNTKYKIVFADACNLSQIFDDKSFDLVFSNSVIEHVGDEDRQIAFSREVLRLADAYWIQTPSIYFPFEAHTGVMFYWQRSEKNRQQLMKRWENKMPEWSEYIRETRPLSREKMLELFPDSRLYCEYLLAMEKSYAVYRPIRD